MGWMLDAAAAVGGGVVIVVGVLSCILLVTAGIDRTVRRVVKSSRSWAAFMSFLMRRKEFEQWRGGRNPTDDEAAERMAVGMLNWKWGWRWHWFGWHRFLWFAVMLDTKTPVLGVVLFGLSATYGRNVLTSTDLFTNAGPRSP